jgi:hypothetical protein
LFKSIDPHGIQLISTVDLRDFWGVEVRDKSFARVFADSESFPDLFNV